MTSPLIDDPLLKEVRARAKRADWTGVRTLGTDPSIAGSIEVGLLVGEAELRQGDTAQAKVRLQWVVPEAERLHDQMALRRGTNMLGAALFELGELAEAEAVFEQALRAAGQAGDHLTGARATNNLGMIANVRGQHEAALALYRVALPAYQRLGFSSGLGETAHNIAITLRDLGQLDEAEKQERRAIEYATDAGNRRLAAIARSGRAELSLLRGEPEVALADGRRAAFEFEQLGDSVSEAEALRIVGRAEWALGVLDEATAHLTRAVQLATTHAAPLIAAESRRVRAELHWQRGYRDLAAADVAEASALFDKLGATAERERLMGWWADRAGA